MPLEDLTLCMICKNGDSFELKTLPNTLASVRGYIENICVTVTVKTEDEKIHPVLKALLEDNGAKISKFVWCNDFAKARNFNMACALTDYVIWLDSDDTLHGVSMLDHCLSLMKKKKLNAIYLMYQYDFNKDWQCINEFPRERILYKRVYEWKARLHENAICKYKPAFEIMDGNLICVKHDVRFQNIQVKAERNLQIIKEAYEDDKPNGDQRDGQIIYDYARSLHAMSKLDEAFDKFEEFLGYTTSETDFYDALVKQADICIHQEKLQTANKKSFDAIKIKFGWPQAYINLARVALLEEDWQRCMHWLLIIKERALSFPVGIPFNPMQLQLEPIQLAQECMFQMNKPKEAYALIMEGLRLAPSDAKLNMAKECVISFLNRMKAEEGYQVIHDYLKSQKKPELIENLLKSVPDEFKDLPWINRLLVKTPEKSKRLVIYCGPSMEEWGPESEDQGIGGSEEAVINMSRQLSKLGWKVEVYCSCINPGNHGGVIWKQYYEYFSENPCEVLILWRLPEYLNKTVHIPDDCDVVLLWCHDKQKIENWKQENVDLVDKIMVLSEYHRKDLPEIPDEKFFISANGINAIDFIRPKSFERSKHNYIYASSPDRGLEFVLECWPKIKEFDPKAKLHVYYGFTKTYDLLIQETPWRREFKEMIMTKVKELPDIHWHGMVGHKKLANAFCLAAYWLYPTDFPEISCVTAMKAQAAGCWPIVNKYAALAETVQFGSNLDGSESIKNPGVLDKWLTLVKGAPVEASPERRALMQEWALKKFSWENVAKTWDDLIKSIKKGKGM